MRIILILFILFNAAYAMAEEKITAVGKAFIQPPLTARAMGLGSAFTGLSDDINAVSYNPAGLAQINKQQFSIMHIRYFENIYQDHTGYIQPLGKKFGVMAVNVVFLHLDDVIQRNEFGGETNRYRNYDLASVLSCAYPLNNILIGFNTKYLTQHLGTISNIGIGFDMGMLYRYKDLRLGVVYQNSGKEVIFKEIGNVLQDMLRVGICYSRDGFITTLDIKKPKDEANTYHLGVEYGLMGQRIKLRAGSIFSHDFKEKDFVAGGSVRLWYVDADYAYLTEEELDRHHRVSVTIKFL